MQGSGTPHGIILDATLIRSVLVPATVAMMGKWNWWLPGWVARVLRVPLSPLHDDAPPRPGQPVLATAGR